nr:ComF family protein [uncultured Pseudomonas sp.]
MNCQLKLAKLVYNWSIFNQKCLLCDGPALQPYALCEPCEHQMPWLADHCSRCALPLAMAGLECGQCHRRPPAFEQVIVPWHFTFPVDTMISRFKHNRQWPLGRLMGEMAGNALSHHYAEGLPRPDVLLPVPMTKRRLRERGFNQAAMLARWWSRQLAVPCFEHLLVRTRHTTAQQHLSAKARWRNLRQAFAVCGDLSGKHVALVDDVLTTGATAQAIALVMRKAGAVRVDVYCLARTPKPGYA